MRIFLPVLMFLFLFNVANAENFIIDTSATKAAADITATHVAMLQVPPYAKELSIQNTLDQDVYIATNSNVDGMLIHAATCGRLNIESARPWRSTSGTTTIYIKHAGTAPTSGKLSLGFVE